MKSHFGQQERKLDELVEEVREIKRRLAGFEQDARQLRLAMEADVPSDTKTRVRTESTATAVEAMHGENVSANRVDPNPKRSTSFGNDSTGPTALPRLRDDALVGNSAAAPKPCLSTLKMRTTTAAGDVLPAGTTSRATRTTSDQPLLWFCPTKEKKLRTSILYASCYSIFGRINNQQAPFWPRNIETKSGQNLVFDPGGSTGRLCACPFLGTWRALLSGEFYVRELDEAVAFFGGRMTRESSTPRSGTCESFTPCVLRSIVVSPQPSCLKKMSCRQRWHEAI